MRISDWSSDVCSSDLELWSGMWRRPLCASARALAIPMAENEQPESLPRMDQLTREGSLWFARMRGPDAQSYRPQFEHWLSLGASHRSEEHTSELQSLMRISYAVFCLKKKTRH